ncbi:methyltransferase domain-containing protein [Candidatus Uhrbacteria bacterium]|nr:methyltransferase domain-containing protein [Candidatus Uhrbacteria bacterium]
MPISLNEEQRSKKKLNLGCGDFPIAGALNVDVRSDAKADVILDLNSPQALLELPHGHYEHIVMDHCLEHLDDAFGTLRSCFELMSPGGTIEIRTPHASRGFTHAEHKHGFDVGLPYYLNPKYPAFYYGPSFELVSLRLDWIARFDIYDMVVPKWQVIILRIMNAIITPLANASPGLCSRLWCYWVGGFEQIEYVFRKPKA